MILTVNSTPSFSKLTILNDVGGTTCLPNEDPLIEPDSVYRVLIIRSWDDYEIGWRAEGLLVDQKDIEEAREAGTTGYTPKDYREYGPDHTKEVSKAAEDFNPQRVFVGEFDLV